MAKCPFMIGCIALMAVTIVGCGEGGIVNKAAIAAAKSAVKSKLTYPDTAKFGEVWLSAQEWGPPLVCGYVSARDRLTGESTGYQRFVYAGSAGDTHLEEEFDDRIQFDATWNEFC